MVGTVARAVTLAAVVACAGALTVGCAPAAPTAAPTAAATTAAASARATATPTPTLTCTETIVRRMPPAERAGQLIMVGLDARDGAASLDPLIAQYHVGGVVLLGGWRQGRASTQAATTHLQAAATAALGLLVAADQEGGQIQQLRGDGFSDIPSGLEQGTVEPAALRASARGWGGELASAGVNLDLAPIADTVPEALGRGNPPIGGYDRQFSSDPGVAASHVTAVVQGMLEAGVATSLKHFPGLGRVTGNTDDTDVGTTDAQTTTADLQPFEAGIRAGAPLVMMSSAIYTRIDPGSEAVFSPAIVTDLLRHRLGFRGVIMSDDIGAAAAVAATPVTQRATRFVGAGGDIALTADPAAVAPFHAALVAAMAADPSFATKVEAAVTRVVDLKLALGLARCG